MELQLLHSVMVKEALQVHVLQMVHGLVYVHALQGKEKMSNLPKSMHPVHFCLPAKR